MAEDKQATEAAESEAQRTFTQEDVDRIVRERVARVKAEKPADYDELREKAARYDEAQEEARTELERANERAERAESELAEARRRIEHASLVSKVSRETGVPADLLHGETEEELASSASAVSAYVESVMPGHPRDKGGASAGGAQVTDETINQIRDPLERVRMRAANAGLYRQ